MTTDTVADKRLDADFVRLAVALLTGVLAVVFDTTIVNIALDTIGRQLHASVATIQWVTTGYLLALGMVVPVTGWLLDRVGGKRLWLAALALFVLASIGSSLAWSAPSLIAFRVLQGVGGGLMLPVMQTLLVQATGGRSLARATAIISLPVLLGPVLGPVLGGLIVQHLSWRWIFWVNVPLGVVGLILAARIMPADHPDRGARLDSIGVALLSPGIAAIVFGLTRVVDAGGFGQPGALIPLAIGVALVVAFVIRASGLGERALVDVRLFGSTAFRAATALNFLSGFVLYGAMLLVPLYLQQVRGEDAVAAGLLLAPQGIGVLLSRGLAGALTDRFGARWVTVASIGLVAAATIPLAFVDSTTSVWLLAAVLVVRGIGLGGVTIPVMTAAYQGLPRDRVPHASIATRTAQQIGGSFGTAVLAVILTHETLRTNSLVTAYDNAFWWSLAFTGLAVVIALWLPARPAAGQG